MANWKTTWERRFFFSDTDAFWLFCLFLIEIVYERALFELIFQMLYNCICMNLVLQVFEFNDFTFQVLYSFVVFFIEMIQNVRWILKIVLRQLNFLRLRNTWTASKSHCIYIVDKFQNLLYDLIEYCYSIETTWNYYSQSYSKPFNIICDGLFQLYTLFD